MENEALEDDLIIANEEKDSSCPLCIDTIDGTFSGHIETKRHIYNYILKNYNDHKKSKAKNRNGIEVGITAAPYRIAYVSASGTAKTLLDIDAEGVKYTFDVTNVSKNPILLTKAWLLHPYQVFELDYDISKTSSPLLKGDSRLITVDFRVSGIGCFDVPVCFGFHRSGDEFLIIKTMAIEVTRDLTGNQNSSEEENEASPFTAESWGHMDGFIRMEGPLKHEALGYEIPREYKSLFRHKLTLERWDDISDSELQDLTTMLASFPAVVGYSEGLKKTHNHFFHSMLWLDEYYTSANLHKYNMKNVPMRLVVNNQVELQVPGLAEKRPSVITGDILMVRVKYEDGSFELEGFEGRISKVNENTVWIRGFHYSLLNRLYHAEQRNVKVLFDVRFTLGRWPMYVQHLALDKAMDDGNMDVIFPEEREPMKPLVPNNHYKYYNQDISSSQNAEQMAAVDHIIKGSSRPAPYIVFGPPGTGKTVTIVESILQIKSLFRSSHVLVCAPSNSACDHIVQLLIPQCSPQELLRLTSRTRDRELVPKDIHNYTNPPEQQLKMEDLMKYRIIVCTLVGATRFSKNIDHHFTHVFIDEAGQAVEPEALVAIGGILGPVFPTHPGGQLVLAGDPKQLGPICASKLAEAAGLGMSLLQRLMDHCPLYQRGEDGTYNERYFTKLLDNYRSHPTLLELPNKLFYDGELRAKCGGVVLMDPLCSARVLNANGPLVFHGVIGHERKEGKSPSFFNQLEIDAVMQYVKALLDPGFKPTVNESEIGVISPYIRQVYKLKRSFESRGWNNIEVGTTETFQGREKRVILISTVRANRNLLDYDRNFKLGFLVNQKRFNVAVTRARSLLIVIGCPHVLDTDECWKALIAAGTPQGSNVGCAAYNIRDEQWTNEVIERVKGPSKEETVSNKKEKTVSKKSKDTV